MWIFNGITIYCLLTKAVFSSCQWVASIDVVENEEASASVVVKMTNSFTEQADQVIPEKAPHLPKHCGRETLGRWGGGFPQVMCFN